MHSFSLFLSSFGLGFLGGGALGLWSVWSFWSGVVGLECVRVVCGGFCWATSPILSFSLEVVSSVFE